MNKQWILVKGIAQTVKTTLIKFTNRKSRSSSFSVIKL